MKTLIELFLIFAKVGLFTVGGGYAMIPLITQEIVQRSWLTLEGVIDIIAISEMTPGPFAINSATFIGVRQMGLIGGASSTLGVVMPSFIIVVFIAKYFTKFKDHPVVKSVLSGLRPAVIGLITSSAFMIAKKAFIGEGAGSLLASINWKSLIIFALALAGILKLKIHPAILIILCGVLGVILFAWL